MQRLFCLPVGESYRSVMIDEIIEHFRENEQNRVMLVLPNAVLFTAAAQEVLAKDPACYERLKIVSFDHLVQEILEKIGTHRTFMSRMTQELLMEKIVDELLAQGSLAYFREMRPFPGFIRTLTEFIGELKRSGTTPDEWLAAITAKAGEIDTPQPKDFEIALVYQNYQRQLAILELADLEECYFLAIDALRQQPEKFSYQFLYFSEFYLFTPLQMEILELLKNSCELTVALAYERNRPELYEVVETSYGALSGMGFSIEFCSPSRQRSPSLESLGQRLFQEDSGEAQPVEALTLVYAARRQQEVERVGAYLKQQLLAAKMQAKDMVILVRDESRYQGLFSLFQELKIPLNWLREEPLAGQALVRLLDDLIAARQDGGSKASVQRLLKSGFIARHFGWNGDYWVRRSVSRRLNYWKDWFTCLADQPVDQEKLMALKEQVDSLPRMGSAAQLEEALLAFLQTLDIEGQLGTLYRQGLPLLRLKTALLTYQALQKSMTAIRDGLHSIGQQNRILSLAEYRNLLLKTVSLETIRVSEGNCYGVRVMNPAEIRGVRYHTVCILGLTEGEFPRSLAENWLYNDRERKLFNDLGIALPMAAKRRQEEKFYFAVSLAAANCQLFLSGLSDSETLPSPFLAEIERIALTPPSQRETLDINRQFADLYQDSYSEGQFRQKAIYEFYSSSPDSAIKPVAAAVLQQFTTPDFERKQAAQQSREQSAKSGYAGFVPQWEAMIRTRNPLPAVWNVSQLETYIQCPFAYFLLYVLRPDLVDEAVETIAATVNGDIYHRVLRLFLAKYSGEKLQEERKKEYETELLSCYQKVTRDWQAAERLSPGQFWRYERAKQQEMLLAWLAYEIKRQTVSESAFRPAYFEWSFGLPLGSDSDPHSTAVPLKLQNETDSLQLCGKVDRIDSAMDHYVLYDYKKSATPGIKETLENGTDLQLPLYIAAVEKLLAAGNSHVVGGAYYSVEGAMVRDGLWREAAQGLLAAVKINKKCYLTEADWGEFYRQFTAKIFTAVAAIRAGDFPPLPTTCSNYCQGRGICRQGGEE